MCGASVVLVPWLFVGRAGHAQGQSRSADWQGNGAARARSARGGQSEQIKCRASYDILNEQQKLQLNIRCGSGSLHDRPSKC